MLDRARRDAFAQVPGALAPGAGSEGGPGPAPGAPPRRRLRDRLVERDGTANPILKGRYELSNVMLLVDDDLRETALAITGIEGFLAEALRLIDSEEVTATELAALARDEEILDRIETLEDTLASLRRRLGAVAASLR